MFFKTPKGAKLIKKNKEEAKKPEVKEEGVEEEENEAQESERMNQVAEAEVWGGAFQRINYMYLGVIQCVFHDKIFHSK